MKTKTCLLSKPKEVDMSQKKATIAERGHIR